MTELSGSSHSNLLEWIIPFLYKETIGSILFSFERAKEEVVLFLPCGIPAASTALCVLQMLNSLCSSVFLFLLHYKALTCVNRSSLISLPLQYPPTPHPHPSSSIYPSHHFSTFSPPALHIPLSSQLESCSARWVTEFLTWLVD